MARNYLRPGIRAAELKDLQQGRVVLVDPTTEDMIDALKTLQKRCRKNLLSLDTARDFVAATLAADSPDGWLGNWVCPRKFDYGIDGTCLQIVRLVGGPTACYVERMHLNAGEATKPRVPAISRRVRSPIEWQKAVIATFWTHLSDEEIQRQEEWAAGEVLQRFAAARGANAKRARARRCKQVETLIEQRGARPLFTAELKDALQSAADELEAEGAGTIRWQDFKRRWVSVSARYKEELAMLWSGQLLEIADLRSARVASELDLSLGVWLGAQRIFNAPQLVFRITCASVHQRLTAGDEKNQHLSREMRRIAGARAHPGTENTVGWLRVHIDDDNRLCFVDEVQSDVIEELLRLAEEGSDRAQELAKDLRPWLYHGFATVKRWADALGYRVGIHSRHSAQVKPGMTASARKWNVYYRAIIKRFGLVEAQVPGYPKPIYANIGGSQ